ncbi:MAG: gentisate 1,2-dioxygenase [Herpetosiphonaceae bacterium]|nr:MAG: gentisate 1,2-dioxygenase [Herpetosiphonaceae bacterium]
MRLVTYEVDRELWPGAVVGEEVVDLSSLARDLLGLIDLGPQGLEEARSAVERRAHVLPLSDVNLHAPIPRPRKNIVCLGMNYAEHAYESLRAKGLPPSLPEHPVFFTKPPTTVNRPDGMIPLDPAITKELDWEVELAFIIGRSGTNIPRDRAMEYVFGYTIINDITARDLQRRHQQFFKGKSLDGSCPMGPWIVTADELPDISNLALRLRVNGEVMQSSSTSDLIFDIPTIIATLSLGQTLEPGDIIATGTPSGVGMGRNPQVWLKPGDIVEAEVEGIGVLRSTVVLAGA